MMILHQLSGRRQGYIRPCLRHIIAHHLFCFQLAYIRPRISPGNLILADDTQCMPFNWIQHNHGFQILFDH